MVKRFGLLLLLLAGIVGGTVMFRAPSDPALADEPITKPTPRPTVAPTQMSGPKKYWTYFPVVYIDRECISCFR